MNISAGTIYCTDIDTRITGNIDYEFRGMYKNHLKHAMKSTEFAGFRYYSDCDKKAKAIHHLFQSYDLHYGSINVNNVKGDGFYGYAYFPPLEYHAWLQKGDIIIDPGLYGTIEAGLMAKDQIGIILEGRVPFMLAGEAPEFISYQSNLIYAYDTY